MATPRVTLQSRNVRGKTVFHLDYRINGKRFRPKVGTSKRDAELIRAKVERDILLGTYQVSASKKAIGLGGLIDEFLDARKHSIRETSLHRYRNYFDPLRHYFDKSFPAVTSDVSLIETKYLRKFIDDAVDGRAMGGKKWSRRTGNDATIGTAVLTISFRRASSSDLTTGFRLCVDLGWSMARQTRRSDTWSTD